MVSLTSFFLMIWSGSLVHLSEIALPCDGLSLHNMLVLDRRFNYFSVPVIM